LIYNTHIVKGGDEDFPLHKLLPTNNHHTIIFIHQTLGNTRKRMDHDDVDESKLPDHIQRNIAELKKELEEGYLTVKGFRIKRDKLLAPFRSMSLEDETSPTSTTPSVPPPRKVPFPAAPPHQGHSNVELDDDEAEEASKLLKELEELEDDVLTDSQSRPQSPPRKVYVSDEEEVLESPMEPKQFSLANIGKRRQIGGTTSISTPTTPHPPPKKGMKKPLPLPPKEESRSLPVIGTNSVLAMADKEEDFLEKRNKVPPSPLRALDLEIDTECKYVI
jgi:hypothetical protein